MNKKMETAYKKLMQEVSKLPEHKRPIAMAFIEGYVSGLKVNG